VAYGTVSFFRAPKSLAAKSGFELVKFFFLLTFAAAIPAIVSGGIAERAKFGPQLMATAVHGRAVMYPVFEGITWNQHFGVQAWMKVRQLAPNSMTLPAAWWCTRWVAGSALAAVFLLGARANRYRKDGGISRTRQSSIPFLALGAWILAVGWFGFNVMSAQTHRQDQRPGGGELAHGHGGRHAGGIAAGKERPGFCATTVPLAGLVAVCAGSDVMHPLGALVTGGMAGAIFVLMFTLTQNRWKIDDVLGVWPLHGLCGTWGGIACGIFGSKAWAVWVV
jgi:Amt family ammonium transporter